MVNLKELCKWFSIAAFVFKFAFRQFELGMEIVAQKKFDRACVDEGLCIRGKWEQLLCIAHDITHKEEVRLDFGMGGHCIEALAACS